MVSFEQIRIVLERENIFAFSVYGACTELQVGPRADKSNHHSIGQKVSSAIPRSAAQRRARPRDRSPHQSK
jgi:hypothetical protein